MIPLTARLAGIVVLVALIGCEKGSQLPGAAPVSGKVTMDGRPFEGATVQFIATGSTASNGAFGVTDASGQYQLQTAPGEYKVVVSRMVLPDGMPLPKDAAPANVGARETVPPRFSKRDITNLKATVPAGGSSALDFQLQGK